MKKFIQLFLAVLFLLPIVSWGQTTYYSKSTMTTFNTLADWGTNSDGSGTNPLAIDNTNDFVVSNNATVAGLGGSVTVRNLTIESGASLTLDGTNTLTSSGTGGGTITINGTLAVSGSVASQLSATNLTINSGGAVTNSSSVGSGQPVSVGGTFTISDNGIYTHSTIRSANIGLTKSFSNNSNFIYTLGSGFQSSPLYGNLRWNGSTSLTVNASSLTVKGQLRISNGTFNLQSTTSGSLTLGGEFLVDGGTFNSSSGVGVGTIVFSTTGQGSGNIQISSGSASFQNITINASRSVSLLSNISIPSGSSFSVSGTLVCGTNVISGAGTFNLASGATLKCSHASGLNGNITTTTTNYDAAANFEFNGSTGAQVTGSAFTSANNLTINNSAGVSLSTNAQVTGTLTLTSGLFTLGSSSLSLGNSTTISGTPSSSNMIVATGSGYLTKGFSGTGSFTFPVGDNTGTAEYSPATLNFTSGTFSSGSASVNLTNSKHGSNTSATSYIDRYWTVVPSGISSFSSDVTFTYVDADIHGTESNIYLGKYSSGTWTLFNVATTGSNQLTGTVSSFSDFTGGESSALPVELTSFTSNVIGNKVELNWKTATEVNNYGFEVQRLAVSNQLLANSQVLNANGWTKIGFVDGNGNSNSPKSYSFTDEPTGGKEFNYRLKQIDFDGTYEYSDIVTAALENVSTFALEQNFPNPFNPTTKISYTIPEKVNVKLKIYDMIAQQVAELVNSSQEAGRYQVTFDGSGLPSGVYFYKLEAGKFVEVKKFMLVK
jgi:hypothetical protein